MLSAFRARTVLELKQRDKSKIESVLAYGDRILVGLNTGSLRIYRVNEPSPDLDDGPASLDPNASNGKNINPKPRPVDLLQEKENFSRRPIQQLAIVKEANVLVSLSDGFISIHDLQSYALQERLEKTKGATSFAITSNIVKDQATGIPSIVSKLAVAVKRRIFVWTWVDMEISANVAELTLASTIKFATWVTATSIVAGMDPGFVIVDTESSSITDIYTPNAAHAAGDQAGVRFGATGSTGMNYVGMSNWNPKPLVTKVSGEHMLLVKDVNTLFIDKSGKALDRRQIPWASALEAVGYSYPYLLALQQPLKGMLEVRNPKTLSLLQSISLPNATGLYVPRPNISLAHAAKGFLVASDRCVWQMNAQNYDSQIDELVAGEHYDEAISILDCLEGTLLSDKTGRLRDVKILKATKLFKEKRYRQALDLFSEAQAPPKLVISFYPESIAGDLSSVTKTVEEQEGNDTKQEEITQVSEEVPKTPERTPNKSARLLAHTFRSANKKSAKVPEQSSSKPADTVDKNAHKEQENLDKEAEKKDLQIAVNELCAFLAQTRVHLQKFIGFDGKLKITIDKANHNEEILINRLRAFLSTTDVTNEKIIEEQLRDNAELVDTTLFRAYMFARPGLAGSLFRLDNFCDPAVIRKKLYENGRYADLIDFLHGKKLHREALELLTDFGQGRRSKTDGNDDDNNDKTDNVTASDNSTMPSSPTPFQGPSKVIAYLQQLPSEYIDLILEFVVWPLEQDPNQGMAVFLADSENAEKLPRHQVLQFLERRSARLATMYLAHIINELADDTPEFHQRLVELYLQRYRSLRRGVVRDGETSEGQGSDLETDKEMEIIVEKLQAFLKESEQFNKSKVFRQLPNDDFNFLECQAIVLSKMGQHKQALQIYVFQLRDYHKAEEYCNSFYLKSTVQSDSNKQEDSSSSLSMSPASIYNTLLSLYLLPPKPHEQNWPPALDLLSRHGARIPAPSTLDLIPESLPLRDLESYFHGQLRSSFATSSEERVTTRLHGVQKVDAETALLVGDGLGSKRRRSAAIAAAAAAAATAADQAGPGSIAGGAGAAAGSGAEALSRMTAGAMAARKGRNRKIIIDESRHCIVCHKRFGGSAVRVYPDNSIVHYGCFGAGQKNQRRGKIGFGDFSSFR